MIKTHFQFGCQQANSFHAEVPMIVRPKVKDIGEYYEDENGKTYVKELFDKFFNAEKRKVKNKFYKGEIIGSPFFENF